MHTVNEGSTLFVAIKFTDQTGAAVTPQSLELVVTDMVSATEVLRDDSYVLTDNSIDIDLPVSVTTMIDSTKDFETRVLNWHYTYTATVEGVDKDAYGSGEYLFRVKNLTANKS